MVLPTAVVCTTTNAEKDNDVDDDDDAYCSTKGSTSSVPVSLKNR